jgi:hypothetical protein
MIDNQTLDKAFQDRFQAFLALKNNYEGERVVIIGNGPSINKTDLSLLKNEYTIGLNKVYLLFDRIDWRPTFITSYIADVVEQCREAYLKLGEIPTFISHEAREILTPLVRDNMFYYGPHKRFQFSLTPYTEVCCGYTVTYVAIQLAYHLGFSKVILIGVDHRFDYSGPSDKWHVMKAPDQNHFCSNYFDTGQNWQAPNLEMATGHYAFADLVFKRFDREIVDCTVNGALDVFRKSDLKKELGK